MRKNRGERAVGYTLVEVLIFVALTSFLLIFVVPNLTASQRNTEFSQAVRDFESLLSDVINDTPTGYFRESSDQTCSVTGGVVTIADTPPTTALGENSECIYVGKAIQFNPSGTSGEEMHVYTVAGRRIGASGGAPTSITDAYPTAVASSSGGMDTVEEIRMPADLTVTRVFLNGIPTPTSTPVPGHYRDILVIATDVAGSTLENGSTQQVTIGGLDVSGANTKANTIATIDSLQTTALPTSTNGIVICLQSGSGKRASVTVGAAGAAGAFLRIDDFDVNGGCTA